ncbi:hypothetical protein BD311DRAFT_748588 [Dichomitus squalens]|uniref:Uncharacterized protein n=1 Tax=Dichomitus squalens TaxID=114155 RepID=A0A4Q9N0V4_9APHY|nr:hypothetical protein BD311DRAFT_748588 [Dichomitus squalens]
MPAPPRPHRHPAKYVTRCHYTPLRPIFCSLSGCVCLPSAVQCFQVPSRQAPDDTILPRNSSSETHAQFPGRSHSDATLSNVCACGTGIYKPVHIHLSHLTIDTCKLTTSHYHSTTT